MSIAEAQKEWKDLAKGDEELTDAIAWMQDTFIDAPTLGSLIEPKYSETENVKPWIQLTNALENKHEATESGIVARGLVKSTELLTIKYHWLVTNVPFLGIRKQNIILQKFLDQNYFAARHDLASAMIQRCTKLLNMSGNLSVVSPQTWQYQSSYKDFRNKLYMLTDIVGTIRLGAEAFETISGQVVTVCLSSFNKPDANYSNRYFALDLSNQKIEDKISNLNQKKLLSLITPKGVKQNNELNTDELDTKDTLESYSIPNAGMATGDSPRFYRNMWELPKSSDWEFLLYSVDSSEAYSGRSTMILWENEQGSLKNFVDSMKHLNSAAQRWKTGHNILGLKGVAISRMGKISTSIYYGEFFDQNCAVLVPKESGKTRELVSYCQDESYSDALRKANPNLAISSSTVAKASFDQSLWEKKASNKYPNGVPLPYTDSPTNWLYHGHPCNSVVWNNETKTTAVADFRQDDTVLQVTVARLLGYQWPAELDTEMELAPEMREVMKKNADFADLVDDDGIVCIPAVRGEKSAAKRLEAMLLKAYGDQWDSSVETNLLKAVKAKDLESWLRDKFFEQHCKLFQHRPFIWHIWDGLKDGFSALVNYHQLDYKGLERLIYTYLDDWISNQKRQLAEGTDGADIRLTAAENLKVQLIAILEGEEGLDIFVRWKPLEEQPIGWNPDLNDGVRLNIRPFMLAKDVGKKGAGVLRAKPNIHWKKDRGTDVESAPWYDLGLEYGGKQGDRINEHHLSLAVKRAAREAKE
jgi:hypothetical protein